MEVRMSEFRIRLMSLTDHDLDRLTRYTDAALDQAAKGHQWARAADAQRLRAEIDAERQMRSEIFRASQTELELGV